MIEVSNQSGPSQQMTEIILMHRLRRAQWPDLPTTDFSGWFGDRTSVWSATVVPPRLRSGYGQQLSLERTQFVTKTPEGFEHGLTNEKWTVYGQESDVLLGSETMAGLTSSTSPPTGPCPRH